MLWLILSLIPVSVAQDACEKVSVGELAKVNVPSVLVLGERKGTQPDLVRAAKVVKALQKSGPVTLALQAVDRGQQSVLDQLTTGALSTEGLEEALGFHEAWGAPITGYLPLFALADDGVRLVAIGGPVEPRAEDDPLPLPPGYIHVLGDAMGEAMMPVELEPRFIQRVAWIDHTLATRALSAWDEQGTLVILADRLHVEGGKGISWQAQRLTEVRVHQAVLAWSDTPCYPDDRLLP
jgi:hypothetical protein